MKWLLAAIIAAGMMGIAWGNPRKQPTTGDLVVLLIGFVGLAVLLA